MARTAAVLPARDPGEQVVGHAPPRPQPCARGNEPSRPVSPNSPRIQTGCGRAARAALIQPAAASSGRSRRGGWTRLNGSGNASWLSGSKATDQIGLETRAIGGPVFDVISNPRTGL
jgi:hypothetical protein